jgi:glutathione S-transferase
MAVRLYDATGPNPRVVRMFIAEKGIDIPTTVLVIGTGQNFTAEYLARNPLGQVPVLETDIGTSISETLAICEYLEELHPEPPLFGHTPEQRGETRMWARRVDLMICEPLLHAYRMSPAGWRRYRERSRLAPEGARAMREIAAQNLAWLDGQLGQREFLCGTRFSTADILLYVILTYGLEVGFALDPQWQGIRNWLETVSARPSVKASSTAASISPRSAAQSDS